MSENFKSVPVKSSEITPKSVYLSRRDFIKAAGVIAGSVALAACAPQLTSTPQPTTAAQAAVSRQEQMNWATRSILSKISPTTTTITNSPPTKKAWRPLAAKFKTSPWDVEVYGLVNKPQKYALEDLIKKFQPEERIYRLRCVEAWSMVIPWMGFPLAKLLKEVEPTSDAKYVRFETVMRPDEMPGQKRPALSLALPGRPAPG